MEVPLNGLVPRHIVFAIALATVPANVNAQEEAMLHADGEISFSGVQQPKQMSAIDRVHDFLAIGVDEPIGEDGRAANMLQLLSPAGENSFILSTSIPLCAAGSVETCTNSERQEMDIEAVAVDGATVYIAGSHSIARRGVDDRKKYKRNRKRTTSGKFAGSEDDKRNWKPGLERNRLVRLTISPDGSLSDNKDISLAPVFAELSTLKPFDNLPSKENGIDIEALAVRSGELHIGFRGPVLRGGFAVVLKASFDKLEDGPAQLGKDDLLFVRLEGLGIRSMTAVSTGFLIVAGPVGDAPGPYKLFHWNGVDMVPGRDAPGGKAVSLGEIETAGGKPEGLVLLQENTGHYLLAIVEDGARAQLAQRFTVPRR